MIFDPTSIAPTIAEALRVCAARLADQAGSSIRSAISSCSERFGKDSWPCPPQSRPIDPVGVLRQRLAAEESARTSADADDGGALLLEWLDFGDALLAHADVQININSVPESEWRLRTTRRFGITEGLEQLANLVTQVPGLGALSWTAVVLHRRGFRTQVKEWSWLRENGSALIAGGDPLSRDERTDIPALVPRFEALPVQAGIARVQVPCELPSPIDSGDWLPTIVTADVSVLVDSRGAHMSRLQEAIQKAHSKRFDSLLGAAHCIARDVSETHPCAQARVALAAPLVAPLRTAVSGRRSSVVLNHSVQLVLGERKASKRVSLSVGVVTACPCTLRYSGLVALRALNTASREVLADLPPTFTHSQPGLLKLTAQGSSELMPTAHELWLAASSSAHIRQAVLKRPDEHQLVEAAHRRPQFCEDLVRDAIVELATLTNDPTIRLEAEAALDESIHPHRAIARVAGTASRFWACE